MSKEHEDYNTIRKHIEVAFTGGRYRILTGKRTVQELREYARLQIAADFQAMIDEAREELMQAGLTAEDANLAIEVQLTKLAHLNFWSKQP